MARLPTLSNLGELDVVYKYHASMEGRPELKNPQQVVDVLKHVFDTQKMGLQEQLVVIYLNRQNRVIGTCNMFKGSHSSIVIDMRLILGAAIKIMASGIIVSHNHPSGNLKSSNEDRVFTKRLASAASLVDMKLIDHLIVTPDFKYASILEDQDLDH
jgi:DNA repair protein RadC